MSEDQISTIQQATDFVNAGKFEEALERSRAVLVTDPNSGDAKLIEAIALSQLGNSRDASEAFSAAIRQSRAKYATGRTIPATQIARRGALAGDQYIPDQ